MLEIIESKETRDKMMERSEVLDKVKKLFLIPGMEMMTSKQVAEYFEVGLDLLRKVYERNQQEIDSDGTRLCKLDDFRGDNLSRLKSGKRGTTAFQSEDGTIIEVQNAGVRCFSRRAVLRIAMLLRDSAVAQEIRTQLLNIFEKTSEETRVADIEDEQTLMGEFGKQLAYGNNEEALRVFCLIQQLHKKHIQQLTEANEKLTEINKLLADGVNTWDNRSILNAMVRAVTHKRYGDNFQAVWNMFYKRLHYTAGIWLKGRDGECRLIDKIKPEEWITVLQCAASWCIELNIDVAEVINTTNMAMIQSAE